MSSGPVMIGYVSGGSGRGEASWVRAEFLGSLIGAVSGPESDPAIGGVISASAGPLLALGRNLLVSQFLGYDLEWLMMVDTDIVFAVDSVSRLLASADPYERPVVSGAYNVFEKGHKVSAAYVNMSDGTEMDLRPLRLDNQEGTLRVTAVGCGFLLIHRSVFERIQELGGNCWFREIVIDGSDIGEDISFCIRAINAGYPVHVNAAVKVGHIKSAMLGEVN